MKHIKTNITPIICAIILFYLAVPYFVWTGVFANIYVKTILSYILGGLFWKNRKKLKGFEYFLFVFLLVLIPLFTIVGERNFNYFIGILPVLFVPFAKDEFTQQVYKWFLRLYVVIIALSLVSWLLALLGINHPYKTIEPLNKIKEENYNVYPLLVSQESFYYRFYGPFDEPGVIGTLSGILLCIEGIRLKDKKSIILLLSGLCSLSFFFFLVLGVFSVLHSIIVRKSLKRTLFFIGVIIAAFFVIQKVPVLSEELGERFVWDSQEIAFEGDNRINDEVVDYYLNEVKMTKTLWFGVRNKQDFWSAAEGASSFWLVVFGYGLLFALLYVSFFVLYGFYYRSTIWSYLLFLFVFMGSSYQRPNIFSILIVFLFIYFARKDKIELEDKPNDDPEVKTKENMILRISRIIHELKLEYQH